MNLHLQFHKLFHQLKNAQVIGSKTLFGSIFHPLRSMREAPNNWRLMFSRFKKRPFYVFAGMRSRIFRLQGRTCYNNGISIKPLFCLSIKESVDFTFYQRISAFKVMVSFNLTFRELNRHIVWRPATLLGNGSSSTWYQICSSNAVVRQTIIFQVLPMPFSAFFLPAAVCANSQLLAGDQASK